MEQYHFIGLVAPLLPLTERHLALLAWGSDDSVLDENGAPTEGQELSKAEEGQAVIDRIANSLKLDDQYVALEAGRQDDGTYFLFTDHGANEQTAAVLQYILKDLPHDDFPHLRFHGTSAWLRGSVPHCATGWACFITRSTIDWMNTDAWMKEQEKHHMTEQETPLDAPTAPSGA